MWSSSSVVLLQKFLPLSMMAHIIMSLLHPHLTIFAGSFSSVVLLQKFLPLSMMAHIIMSPLHPHLTIFAGSSSNIRIIPESSCVIRIVCVVKRAPIILVDFEVLGVVVVRGGPDSLRLRWLRGTSLVGRLVGWWGSNNVA